MELSLSCPRGSLSFLIRGIRPGDLNHGDSLVIGRFCDFQTWNGLG